MDYFVWLRSDPKKTEGNPRIDRGLHENLIKNRLAELQNLRASLVGDLTLPHSSRELAEASIKVLAGTGQLIVDDEHIDINKLRSRDDLLVLADSPLQPLPVTKTQAIRGPAQPWHLTTINKPATLSGAGVTIGVIDTGYNPALPDLQPPFNAQFGEWQPAKPAKNGQPAQSQFMKPNVPAHDFGTHGSKVCAFLAGNISGVAPGATIIVAAIPVKMILSTQSQFVVALDWLESIGCDIITTSVLTGVPGAIPPSGPAGPGPSLAAVEFALQETRNVHHTFVTAAIGNIGNLGSFQHPGSSISATGIGAVDSTSKLFGSAWGSIGAGVNKPDLVAPGYELELPTSATTHDTLGGTSFATPIVAGAVALILEKHPNLKGNLPGIRAKLATLMRPVPFGPPANSTGAGLLDLTLL